MKLHNKLPDIDSEAFGTAFLYKRARNRYATRSHILIMPSTLCTVATAQVIAAHFADRRFGSFGENRVIALSHSVGCCSVGIDEQLALRVLRNTSLNPNVAFVLVISLGCGSYCSQSDGCANSTRTGKLIVSIQGTRRQEETVIQGSGGRSEAVSRGIEIIEQVITNIECDERIEVPLSSIFAGVMNGSSDPTSGLWANPSVGYVCDFLLSTGGRIAFSQTTEVLGAEDIMIRRAGSERTRTQMISLLSATTMMRLAVEREGIESEPTQGNIRSGISTLAEKSVGTVAKIGNSLSHSIVGVVPHGKVARPIPGIHFVDTPGQDVLSLTGLVAAGSTLILFTTGRGAPTGSPISPTVKITANRTTYENLSDIIDVYIPVEEIFDRGHSLQDIALNTLIPFIRDVVSGVKLTAAERYGQQDLQVRQLWPIE